MHPRGVTLVEILAAVSIMVVVTALSLPAVQGRLSAARLDAAQAQVDAAVIATRAESVKRGVAIELLGRAGAEGVELCVRTLESPERSPGEAGQRESGEPPRKGSLVGVLPPGFELVGAVPLPPGSKEDSPVHAETRIAVFCPDGTAIGTACVLRDGPAVYDIKVASWVGGASFSIRKPEEDAQEDHQEVTK